MKPLHIHYLMPQGIGDIIMTVPVLKEINRVKDVIFSISVNSRTEASIINKLCTEMTISFIYLKEIYDRHNAFISFLILVKKIRKLSPDIILTQFNVKSYKSSLIAFLSGIKIRAGWEGKLSFLNTHTYIPSSLHKIEENLKSLNTLNIKPENPAIKYPLYQPEESNPDYSKFDKILKSDRKIIAISPGSKEQDKHKRWPISSFSQLINKILAERKDIRICLVGSMRENRLCEDIIKNIDQEKRIDVINLAGDTSLPELLYVLSNVNITITNCNGISHMACLVNSPIIGLYGPTDYKITGPISDKFIPVTAGLDCSPCYRSDYVTGCGDPVCMVKLDVKQVYQTLESMI